MSTSPDFDDFNNMFDDDEPVHTPTPADGGVPDAEAQGSTRALGAAEQPLVLAPLQEQTLDPDVQLQQFNQLISALEGPPGFEVFDATAIGPLRPAFPVGYISGVVGAQCWRWSGPGVIRW